MHYQHQQAMNDLQLAWTFLGIVGWMVGAAPTVADTIRQVEGLSDIALMWLALGPGMLGGLSMQLLPAVMKNQRQLAAELICSAFAAIGAVAFFRESMTDVFSAGIYCFLAGAGGSGLIISGVQVFNGGFQRAVLAIFGRGDNPQDGD